MGVAEAPAVPPGYVEDVQEKFVLAADLGQANDPTAVAVLQHRIVRHHHWRGGVKHIGETFDIRHLERLPLGLSYVEQRARIAQLLARPPLKDGCHFVIDNTGVGRAVGDLFDDAGMKPEKVTITAGSEQSCVGIRLWHVPKGILISTLDARLHTAELRFAADLRDAPALQEELKDFRRHVSAAGRYSYEARVGRHDDLVLAVALALWAVVGKPKAPQAAVGTYRSY
jgi:hypothetical protein